MNALTFPFSAIVGQHTFKLALILNAINPAIGGVLVSGSRGMAKSTLARAFADILPPISANQSLDQPNFVTLPLGASAEHLTGSLDINHVLEQQQVKFQAGLLAKAHQGVLYVDEVNLLADHLVDLLLDVAASGVNYIERDGISHSHPAQFILLGTMNPDEGELRSQLQDRFGLAVLLEHDYDVQARIAIVKQREAFERDPAAFCHTYESLQQDLQQRIRQARERLKTVTLSDDLHVAIAERCITAKVDGLRADIVWYRAALAHAAWQQRSTVLLEDINAVEALVLNHRRQENPPDSPTSSRPNPPPFSRPPKNPNHQEHTSQQNQGEVDQSSQTAQGDSDWGGLATEQQSATRFDQSLTLSHLQKKTVSQKKHVKLVDQLIQSANKSDGLARTLQMQSPNAQLNSSTQIDWLASIIAQRGHLPLRRLYYRQNQRRALTLHLIVLDHSASMLQQQLFAKAKGLILTIAQQAYLAREQLSLISIGQPIRTVLSCVRAPKQLQSLLDPLPAGGGTALRDGLWHTYHYMRQLLRRLPYLKLQSYLITDGKTRQALHDLPDLLRTCGNWAVIDVEQTRVKRGRARELANHLQARYIPLAHLNL
ncbi:MAG: ATP-binding protein [bacterium]